MNDKTAPLDLNIDTGLSRDVYALLAQANLLRMRGCWEEAVTNCMDALRLAPDSPSAQSLLGDIYENQGRFDDAIQWYHMALDANPGSPADRLKLDRLLQRQQPLSRADGTGRIADEQRKNVAVADSAPPRLPFWHRFPQSPETALRYGALLAALLVCLVVLFAYATVHRRAALAALGLSADPEVKTTPVVLPPVPVPTTETNGQDTPRDEAEESVLRTLRSSSDLSGQGITVNDVQFDPRSGHVSVTVSLSNANGVTRASVLRAALHTAEAVAASSPSAASFTLRCLTTIGADSRPSLILVGDAAQSALPRSGEADPDDAHILAIVTNAWWSAQMPA